MSHRRDFFAQTAAALGAGVLAAQTSTAAAQQPVSSSPPTLNTAPPKVGSHLGNLYSFVKSQAAGPDFPLSYLNKEFTDLAEWKRRGRARLQELMYYSPAKCEPRPEISGRRDRGDYIQETLTFQTTPDIRVPAFLLIPKNAKQPAPAIIALHDHGGFYMWGKEKLVDNDQEHPTVTEHKRAYDNRSIAVEMVRRGYVVLVIDMLYWGQRRMVMDDDPADWRERSLSMPTERVVEFNRRAAANEQLLGRSIYAAGFTWGGVMFMDDVRSVDYLVSRPEVDPERIGCVGHSIGGLRATHLASLDDRVKAAVVSGWMCSFPYQLEKNVRSTIGHTKLLPGLYRDMDYPDVAALAAPCAMMVINGSQDALFNLEGVHASFAKLKACYEKAGAPQKLRTLLYDRPHEFNSAMQAEAWNWFDKWLA